MHKLYIDNIGFPHGSVVKIPPALQETQETWVRSLVQKDPLEEGMATHSSILAGRIPLNFMDRGLWWVVIHRFTKNQTPLKLLSTHVHNMYIYMIYIINVEEAVVLIISLLKENYIKQTNKKLC